MMLAVSAFNGVGGLAMAFNGLGIDVKILSSEVNKHAIAASNLLHDNTEQIGSILNWREWDIDWPNVDIVGAGSSCQGFSAAGKKGGTKAIIDGKEVVISTRGQYLDAKENGAKFLSESYLVWEFILMLDHAIKMNPKVKFMLENVKMTPNNRDMISDALGVKPVLINAELLLPQNRERLFWCNFDIKPIERKHVNISDIMEEGEFRLRPCTLREKMGTGVCHHIANADDVTGSESTRRVYSPCGKMPTLNTMQGGSREPKFIVSYNPPMYRAATLREMMRGQGWTECVQDKLLASGIAPTNLKALIGNGWPNDVIMHIVKSCFK